MLVSVFRDQVLAINLLNQVLVVALLQSFVIIIIVRVLAKQTLPILLVHKLIVLEVSNRHLRQSVKLRAAVAVEHFTTTHTCDGCAWCVASEALVIFVQ